jgi:hypothetical protein
MPGISHENSEARPTQKEDKKDQLQKSEDGRLKKEI